MRTVLAVDQMLARAVRKRLTGEVVEVDHMAMRDLGYDGAIRKVRRTIIERRSVLVIGGRAWDDPLSFLRDLRLQPFVPVVMLLAAGQELPALSWRPRIFAVVPTEGGANLSSTLAELCQDAWVYAHQKLRPVVTRVVERNEPRRARGRGLAKVLWLGRSGE